MNTNPATTPAPKKPDAAALENFKRKIARFYESECISALIIAEGQAIGVNFPPKPKILT